MRIAALLKSPVPFHREILTELARRCNLTVAYLSPRRTNSFFDDDLPHPGSVLGSRNFAIGKNDIAIQLPRGVRRWLISQKADVVIVHSWDVSSVYVALVAKSLGIPRVMWAESTQYSGRKRGTLSNGLRRLSLGLIDEFVTNGTMASKYLADLGVSESRIHKGIYPVSPTKPNVPKVSQTTSKLPTVAFVGRLIDSKRPQLFVEAVRPLVRRRQCHALVIGDGPLRRSLEAATAGADIEYRGHLAHEDLQALYREIDILVLPSRHEVWGLVVNEALLAGVYVIAAPEVGSVPDLLLDGVTGSSVSSAQHSAWTEAIGAVLGSQQFDERGRAGRLSATRAHVPEIDDPSAFAHQFLKAARRAVST